MNSVTISSSPLIQISSEPIPFDFTFEIDGRKYLCHKSQLLGISSVITNNMDYFKFDKLKDPRHEFEIAMDIINGKPVEIDESTSYFLNTIGEQLGIPTLVAYTEPYVNVPLSISNVFDIVCNLSEHGLDMQNECDFLAKNLQLVIEKNEFNTLPVDVLDAVMKSQYFSFSNDVNLFYWIKSLITMNDRSYTKLLGNCPTNNLPKKVMQEYIDLITYDSIDPTVWDNLSNRIEMNVINDSGEEEEEEEEEIVENNNESNQQMYNSYMQQQQQQMMMQQKQMQSQYQPQPISQAPLWSVPQFTPPPQQQQDQNDQQYMKSQQQQQFPSKSFSNSSLSQQSNQSSNISSTAASPNVTAQNSNPPSTQASTTSLPSVSNTSAKVSNPSSTSSTNKVIIPFKTGKEQSEDSAEEEDYEDLSYTSDEYLLNGVIKYLKEQYPKEWIYEIILTGGGTKNYQLPKIIDYDNLDSWWDNYDLNKKTCTKENAWVQVEFPHHTLMLKHYTIASTADRPKQHQPKSWYIEVSMDGVTWETVHTVTNCAIMNVPKAIHTFEIPKAVAMRYFKFVMTQNHGRHDNQYELSLGALELYGKLYFY